MAAAERQSGLLRKRHQFKWFNAERLSMEDHCSQCAGCGRAAGDWSTSTAAAGTRHRDAPVRWCDARPMQCAVAEPAPTNQHVSIIHSPVVVVRPATEFVDSSDLLCLVSPPRTPSRPTCSALGELTWSLSLLSTTARRPSPRTWRQTFDKRPLSVRATSTFRCLRLLCCFRQRDGTGT